MAAAKPALLARITDPTGNYPVCSSFTQPIGTPFYLSVVPYGSDPAYGAGYVQEYTSGEFFAGTNNGIAPTSQGCESDTKPFFFFAASKVLYDNHGRQIQVSYAGQLQGGAGTTAFSICGDGTSDLTYNGINTFYACKNGNAGSYRIYEGTQVPTGYNDNCNVVHLSASYL